MKLVVLGIDALELTKALEHPDLLLNAFGHIPIPEELYYDGVPYTPLVWTAYLTGRKPGDTGVQHIYETPGWVKALQKIIRYTPLRFIKGKRKWLKKLGINTVKPYHIRGSTVFDDAAVIYHKHRITSVAINVPGINLGHEFYKIIDYIDDGMFDKAISLAYLVADGVFMKVKGAITGDIIGRYPPPFIFAYVNVLDIVGHIHWVKHPEKVDEAYEFVEKWVREITGLAVSRGYEVIVISDHGMKDSGDGVTGTHTKYGFWSSTVRDFFLTGPYTFRRQLVGLMAR